MRDGGQRADARQRAVGVRVDAACRTRCGSSRDAYPRADVAGDLRDRRARPAALPGCRRACPCADPLALRPVPRPPARRVFGHVEAARRRRSSSPSARSRAPEPAVNWPAVGAPPPRVVQVVRVHADRGSATDLARPRRPAAAAVAPRASGRRPRLHAAVTRRVAAAARSSPGRASPRRGPRANLDDAACLVARTPAARSR